ncbi:cysteine-rich RLK (RECEPTOR-like protein kinase) 8 [Hibiscus trionum]|uniref:Cysteine-rich RLK (RECEPTOR-like protein kinase) 8 n=1 Tax=Hibiscus trionum TaxID=183268 RepID=A0A9W7ITY0_HIBTR|nr:cysteine-rich RLK (RECEPTOR-like protein kinase) 8 [Hibiscus trionum]
MVTIHTFLSVAAAKNWELHQMDVHNAFLHGDLEEKVYIKLPPGFCSESSDYSLFTLQHASFQLNVLVYVDDLIVSGNNNAAIQNFKAYLSTCFYMKDLGPLKYFLGIEVARNHTGIFLCQRKYTLDIISEVGLLGAKPVGFPLDQNHHLPLAKEKPLSNPECYRRLVGRLIYLSVTRPELSYSVHFLVQFMQKPVHEHWDTALRVVRYLKDWAGCPLTRLSLTGWFILLGNSPISWKTKKQHVVSRSFAEAKYRSMASTTCELKWLKALLLFLGVAHPRPITLHCDSQAALHIVANPVFHERTKYIDVDCHFVRDTVVQQLIAPQHVSTRVQLTDIFTKALGKQQFDFFLRKLGIYNLHAPT